MDYKIMMVEDDAEIAELLSSHLQKFGFSVCRCKNFSNVLLELRKHLPIWCCWISIFRHMTDFIGAVRCGQKAHVHYLSPLPAMRIRSGVRHDERWG